MTTRSQSLIEQKKLQWIKEREELKKFYGLWSSTNHVDNQRKINDSYSSQINRPNGVHDAGECYNSNVRCLPPIQKSMFNEYIRRDVKSTECNTSGYGSETDSKDQLNQEKQKHWKSQSSLQSYEACSSVCCSGYRDDITSRMKWGDRGVGVGHLWEPTPDFDARLPEINIRPGTPHWLQRSLSSKTHLRGQGIPAEPDILIQRYQKRQNALEFQEAIREQLFDKERKRQEDKEQQMEEEKRLEQRVKKQQELEQFRLEEELKKLKMKEEKENIKSKMMLDALAIAEQLAKDAKTRTKVKILEDIPPNLSENNINNEERNEAQNEISKSTTSWCTVGKNQPCDFNTKKLAVTCDAHTSLTTENYFDEFKSKIPLVVTAWTQTNTLRSPAKFRKEISKSNHERPKWGVNRPNTKYIKQSEKDIFYQRKIKYRVMRLQLQQEPSVSSRSVDSTDEYKSFSSSPHGKDSNLKLNQSSPDDKPNTFDSINNTSIVEDATKEFKIKNNYLPSKQDALDELVTLSNKLEMKRTYWENETNRLSSVVSAISLTAK